MRKIDAVVKYIGPFRKAKIKMPFSLAMSEASQRFTPEEIAEWDAACLEYETREALHV